MNTKHFEDTLEITPYSFDKKSIEKITENVYVKNLWPLIYIISNNALGEAYVGESTNALSRMQNHLNNSERKNLITLHLITCDKFNKSAALNIESNLIKYIAADGKYNLQNGNAGLTSHNYYQKSLYHEVFSKIWDKLKDAKIVQNSLAKIDNSDVFKYSPYKSLSPDQHNSVISLLEFLNKKDSDSIFVEGSAGTGKTVLAIYLLKLISAPEQEYEKDEFDAIAFREIELVRSLKKKYPNPKIALVIPMTSLRQTIQNVFKTTKGLSASMVIGPSEALHEKYDLLVIDEAHRLKRRKGIMAYGSFDNNNRTLGLDDEGTELNWILMQSQNQIFFYDEAQSIKPADVRKADFASLKTTRHTPILSLTSQLRVKGGSDYINYVDDLLHCRLSKGAPVFENNEYEFVIFDSFRELKERLDSKEKQFGLCRLVAGFSWKWASKPKKEKGTKIAKNTSKIMDIEIEGISYRWNGTSKDWVNSKNAPNEIGCIHTTQGYDLNYTGVIFGNEISFDSKTNKIVINKDNYFDAKGKESIEDSEELKSYIINIYKTLMFRGIKGAYIYVCDESLRAYFKKHIHGD